MTETKPTYCFLDANTLMHFQTFDEIDWQTTLNVSSVQLTLAPSVMNELDKFKDDSSNDWRRKRVRILLAKFRKLLPATADTSGPVRKNVSIADIPFEPSVDWNALHLDPMHQDDRLIASIFEFRTANPNADIILITHDYPLERKANRQTILTKNAEDLLSPIERTSEHDREIKTLQTRIETLESRIPKLEFGFREQGSLVNLVDRSVIARRTIYRPTDEKLASIIERERHILDQVISGVSGTVAKDEIKKYQDEAHHYLVEIEVILNRTRVREHDHRLSLDFALNNIGAAAAEDVAINLSFPTGSFVVSENDEDNYFDGFGELEMLKRPIPLWTLTGMDRVYNTRFPGSEPSSRTYDDEYAQDDLPQGPLYFNDRSKALFLHPKLRPTKHWLMDTVLLFLPDTAEPAITIHYEIQAERLAAPQSGELVVRLERS